MKTEVRTNRGTGYIDGYVVNNRGIVYAMVVVGKEIIAVNYTDLTVIRSYGDLITDMNSNLDKIQKHINSIKQVKP